MRKEATKINQLRYLVEEGQEKQPLRFFNQDSWWKVLFISGKKSSGNLSLVISVVVSWVIVNMIF